MPVGVKGTIATLDAPTSLTNFPKGDFATRKERHRGKEDVMSQSHSRFSCPFDIVRHPSLEPEVKRAILASWASDRAAVEDRPAMRRPPGVRHAVPVDDVLAALRSLDGERDDRGASMQ
jgi:hypothetical protein